MSIAKQMDDPRETGFAVTQDFAQWVAGVEAKVIPASAFTWAKHALLDWFGVTIAGAKEPLARMLVDEFCDGSSSHCTVVGQNRHAGVHDTGLINGAISHALDYDDVNRRLHGHPTVCVAPAALAIGEALGSTGREVLASFIVGTEVACNLGEMSDEGHYEAGFHATGTMGTFGAAAAAAYLLTLDSEATANALGIAASQAAGLKSNFGTMTKPLHAGKAVMNGLMAARLAARGFTANTQAIEAPRGFADTQIPDFDAGPIRPDPSRAFAVEETLFKYHAACYLTHATLEAIRDLRKRHDIGLDDVKTITLHFRPTHLSVCCIPEPATGLEIKFSIEHLAVLALDGIDTAALTSYSDANATDPRLITARRNKVRLEPRNDIDRMAAVVVIELEDGRTLSAEGDVGTPANNIQAQWDKLAAKFGTLTGPVIGGRRAGVLMEAVASLDKASDLKKIMEAAR